MSIEKDETYWVTCDICGETVDLDTTVFLDGIEEIKSLQWDFLKDGEKWSHFCPECQEEEDDD